MTHFLLGIILLLVLLIVGIYRQRPKGMPPPLETDKEFAQRLKNIQHLRNKMEILTAAAVPIHEAYQAVLTTKLTHLHTPRIDELLTKVGPPSTLTKSEVIELEQGLYERVTTLDTRIDEAERIAAKIFPDVAKLAILEKEAHGDEPQETILITQPERAHSEKGDEEEK